MERQRVSRDEYVHRFEQKLRHHPDSSEVMALWSMLSEDARVKVGRACADVLTEMSQAYELAPEEGRAADEETDTSVSG
jgi:hypothetical protein